MNASVAARAEAAATTLRARISNLEAALDASDHRVRVYYAEIKRLREALELIASDSAPGWGGWIGEVARKALDG